MRLKYVSSRRRISWMARSQTTQVARTISYKDFSLGITADTCKTCQYFLNQGLFQKEIILDVRRAATGIHEALAHWQRFFGSCEITATAGQPLRRRSHFYHKTAAEIEATLDYTEDDLKTPHVQDRHRKWWFFTAVLFFFHADIEMTRKYMVCVCIVSFGVRNVLSVWEWIWEP